MNYYNRLELKIIVFLACISVISFFLFGNLYLLYCTGILFFLILFHIIYKWDHTEGFISPNNPIISFKDESCETSVRLHITRYLRESGKSYLVIDGTIVAEVYRGNQLTIPITEGVHEIGINSDPEYGPVSVFLKKDTDYLIWRDDRLVYHITENVTQDEQVQKVEPEFKLIPYIMIFSGLCVVIFVFIKNLLQS